MRGLLLMIGLCLLLHLSYTVSEGWVVSPMDHTSGSYYNPDHAHDYIAKIIGVWSANNIMCS